MTGLGVMTLALTLGPALALALALAPLRGAAALEILTHLIFVSSPDSPRVAVIDTDRDGVVAGFSLAAPVDELIISETTRMLVARGESARTVESVELDTFTPGARLSLAPATPRHMRLGADGRVLAIADHARDELVLARLPGLEVIHRVPARQASYMTFGRDGEHLFVASLDGREVAVVDVGEGRVRETIVVGAHVPPGAVTGFARTPGGELGFVLHGDRGLISVIDLDAAKWLRTISLDMHVTRAYPTMNSQYLMVPDRDSASLTVLSTWTFAASWRVETAPDVVDVDTAYFDTLAFAQSAAASKTVVLRLDDQRRMDDIALPAAPASAIASSNGLKLYVGLPALSRVAIIDTPSMKLVGGIDVGDVTPVVLSAVSDRSYCH